MGKGRVRVRVIVRVRLGPNVSPKSERNVAKWKGGIMGMTEYNYELPEPKRKKNGH